MAQVRTSTLTLAKDGYYLRSIDYPAKTLFVAFNGSISTLDKTGSSSSQGSVLISLKEEEISISVLAVIGTFALDLFSYLFVATDSRCRGTIADKSVYEVTAVAALPLDYAAGKAALQSMLAGPNGMKHRKSSLALQPSSSTSLKEGHESSAIDSAASGASADSAQKGSADNNSSSNGQSRKESTASKDSIVQALQDVSINWLSPQIAKLLGRGRSESPEAADQPVFSAALTNEAGSSSAQRMEARIIEELARVFSTSGVFYSYDYDLTRSLQEKDGCELVDDKMPLSLSASENYWFNLYLQRQLLTSEAYEWALPLIQGCIQMAFCEIKGGDSFQVCVLSRRNWRRIGMRYERRGANADGYVANSVDTEQLLTVETSGGDGDRHFASFVQTRGSMPFYWKQAASGLHPAPTVLKSDSENANVCGIHLRREIDRLGRQVLINLVEHKGREAVVGSMYASVVGQCVAEEMVEAQMVRYVPWDFHQETRGMRFENLKSLLEQLKREIADIGYYWRAGHQAFTKQSGVFRVNCMDCLDRTNVVQSTIARFVLNEQLVRLGVHIAPEQGLAAYAGLEKTLNHLWANNGDYISRQYAGTSAMKGDFTRTGKRNFTGVVSDASYSLARLWMSTFRDYFSQSVLDFTMGYQSAGDVFRTLVELRSREPDHALQLSRTREAAIEASIAIAVYDGENIQMACTVQSSMVLDTLKTRQTEDAVLIVTTAAVYLCRYHYQMEKVSEVLRIELSGLSRVQYGAYITDTHMPQSLDPTRNHGLVLYFDAAVARFNSGNSQNKSDIGHRSSEEEGTSTGVRLPSPNITETSVVAADRQEASPAAELRPESGAKEHFIACKLVSEAQVVMQRACTKPSGDAGLQSACAVADLSLTRLGSLENQSPDLLAECLCSVILSAALKTNTVDGSNFIVDAPIISAAAAKHSLSVIDKVSSRIHKAIWI
ncbi:hypothetical protein H4R99_004177 [Coemansia sp. RSA 1722]|nr:hypothetical protein IWW45_007345 [Coemansia sp. RSA 485]KAJ2598254.1 hypothetical protein H4R99_004177 [Coemansia sp. RSA 1722]